jgi:ribosomal protein S18 acetylase RimI-like enzyme
MSDKDFLSKLKVVQGLKEHIPEALGIETESFFLGDQFTRKTYLRALNRANSWFVVLSPTDQVAASFMLLTRKKSRKIRLYSIAVAKVHQGRGIGSFILSWLVTYAKNEHFSGISLEVNISNEAAIRLYQSKDFKKMSLVQHYYADGSEAIKMVKMIK